MLIPGNSLKGNYKNYLMNSLKRIIDGIPSERRQPLAQEIRLKANVLGCKDEEVLEAALEYLTGG